MISQEKDNNDAIYQKLLEVNYKFKILTSSKKELFINEDTQIKKNVYSKTILSNLSQEVSRMKYLINTQDNQITSISDEIANKKGFITRKKDDAVKKAKMMEKQTIQSKDGIMRDIVNLKMLKDTNKNKENFYVKIILGLDLIQT